MPRAILSVYDKTGLEAFARGLVDLGWDLVASGGTARALELAGLPITPVERVTGAPEMLAGRVKTLHPAVHAAILARDTEEDMAALAREGYAPVDLVVSNLYPFQATINQPGVTLDEAIEQIDVGGVALVRAAAKNLARVTVITDPADYPAVLEMLQASGKVDEATRRRLAILRKADAIFREEVRQAGLNKKLWKYFVVLHHHQVSKGEGELALALRAVTISKVSGEVRAMPARLPYDLLEHYTARVLQAFPEVRRVVNDITPGSSYSEIEWH